MITLQQKYFLYAYGDPKDGRIFYIGKGSGKRHMAHLSTAKNGHPKNYNRLFINKIKKILRTGKQPLIHKFMFTYSEAESYQNEKEVIERIGLSSLYNLRQGGEGGFSVSKDSKEKISKTLKEYYTSHVNPWKGKKHSEESINLIKNSLLKVRDRLVENAKNRTYSETTRKKMSESAKRIGGSFRGKEHTEGTKLKISSSKKGITYKNTERAEKHKQAIQRWWDNRRGIIL